MGPTTKTRQTVSKGLVAYQVAPGCIEDNTLFGINRTVEGVADEDAESNEQRAATFALPDGSMEGGTSMRNAVFCDLRPA
jgi:hypothetical protein